MTIDRAKAALTGTRFAALEWVDETGSTNADLVLEAAAGAQDMALVADHQYLGRGRLDRHWQAPPGASLLMSVLVRPPFPAAGPNLLSTALGLAAVDALSELASVEVGLKWPNDVVAPGAGPDGADLKLGGLLAEMTGDAATGAVVLGIGLNVAWSGIGFPEEFAATATAVDLLGGSVEREDLVVALLTALDPVAELASPEACERLVERYRERCVTIGRRVRVELPASELVGTATDVTLDGALVVTDDDGRATTVTVGDVVHLRPAD